MKRIVETDEPSPLEQLLGEKILVFCLNYIYTGTLYSVNDHTIVLNKPSIVYETGGFADGGYKHAESLHCATWNISISAIESFGKSK